MIKFYLAEVDQYKAPGPHPCGLAYDHLYNDLYYSDGDRNAIFLHQEGNQWRKVIDLPEIRTDLAFDGRSLWQIVGPEVGEGRVERRALQEIRINRSTDDHSYRLGKKVDLPRGFKAFGLDFKGELAYVFGDLGTVVVDVRTELSQLPFLPSVDKPGGLTLFDSEMWVADVSSGEIARINADREIIDRVKACEAPTGMTYSSGYLWVNSYSGKKIIKYEVRY